MIDVEVDRFGEYASSRLTDGGRWVRGERTARVGPSARERWILYVNERDPGHRWMQRYTGDLWCGCRWDREAAVLAAIAWCERGDMPEMR